MLTARFVRVEAVCAAQVMSATVLTPRRHWVAKESQNYQGGLEYERRQIVMPQQDFPDALEKLIEAYLRYFTLIGSFGGLLFTASAFLIVREMGIIKEKGFRGIEKPGLIAFTGFCGMALVLIRFLSEGTTLTFFLEASRGAAYAGCDLNADTDVTTFFDTCHRAILLQYVRISAIIMLSAIAAVAWWFGAEYRRYKKSLRQEAEQREDVSDVENSAGSSATRK